MSTTKQRDRGKERFWRSVLRQWRSSGLSARSYCRQHGLSEPSFYGWRRALAELDGEAVRFVPVRVTPEPKPVTAAGPAAGLELVLDAGRVLRIGQGFDATTLQRLLTLLAEGRP